MNNPRRSRPRLVCSVVRLWESSQGPAATGRTRLTARHLEGCAECREFFAEDLGFEQSLRRDAARLRKEIPDTGLERRILRAVMEAGPAPEREARRELSPVWGRALLASAGVAAALAFLLWLRPPAAGPAAPMVVTTEKVGGTSLPLAVAPTAGTWWRTLGERGSGFALAEKNPLEREIDSVRTDARAVIGFLALNFLPTRPVHPTPPGQG